MGIQGLLPLLREVHEHTKLADLAGKTYAVDGYVWLHKGAFACAPQLVRGERTTKYVDYAMARVRLLRHHNIEPYLVFDGGPLPAKQGTESDRNQKREENLAMANALHAQGKHAQAREHYTKCVDITPEMAFQLIKALRAENVRYVVAPYEADAQLAYLERTGIVDGIITEDSDLLVFGCRDVLFKMDSDGVCVRIRKERLTACKETNFVGWGEKEFRWMAMLSGCDYLPSIQGMGLKTSYKLLRRFKTVDRVLQAVRMETTLKVPNGYQDAFELAELAFIYQRVYCPLKERLVYLTERTVAVEWNDEKEAYVGGDMTPEMAKGIALGNICPISREPMKDINPWYTPRALRVINTHPLREKDANANVRRASTGSMATLTSYFTPIPRSSLQSQSAKRKEAAPELASRCKAGGSGKRRLAEDGEWERERKRKRLESAEAAWREREAEAVQVEMEVEMADQDDLADVDVNFDYAEEQEAEAVQRSSRFFNPASPNATRTTSKGRADEDKENVATPQSRRVTPAVSQEDGYLSPGPLSSGTFSACDLSSPLADRMAEQDDAHPGSPLDHFSSPVMPLAGKAEDAGAPANDAFDVSSPISASRQTAWLRPKARRKQSAAGSVPTQGKEDAGLFGVDVKGMFEPSSEIDDWPPTPENVEPVVVAVKMELKAAVKTKTKTARVPVMEADDVDVDEMDERQRKVSAGWWARYSLGSDEAKETPPSTQRRHLAPLQPRSSLPMPAKSARPRAPARPSVPFPVKSALAATIAKSARAEGGRAVDVDDMLVRSKSKLLQFSRTE